MAADPNWTPTPVADPAQHKGLLLDEALSSCLMKKGKKIICADPCHQPKAVKQLPEKWKATTIFSLLLKEPQTFPQPHSTCTNTIHASSVLLLKDSKNKNNHIHQLLNCWLVCSWWNAHKDDFLVARSKNEIIWKREHEYSHKILKFQHRSSLKRFILE